LIPLADRPPTDVIWHGGLLILPNRDENRYQNRLFLSTFSTLLPSFNVCVIALNGRDTTSSPSLSPDRIRIYISSWIPVVTATCFTVLLWLSYTKTYSFVFLSAALPAVGAAAVSAAVAVVSAAALLLGASRVVTAWIGTASPVSFWVWISTVADSPGRKGDGLSRSSLSRSL